MNTSKNKKTKNRLVPVGLYLDAEEVETLRALARSEGRSLSNYVRRIFFASKSGCITTERNFEQGV